MSDSVRPHRRQPTRLPCPWDPPGKNTGVGCHFLLQCMTVKSESEVAQSCPTLMHTEDTRIERVTGTPMFIAALLIIARIGSASFCRYTKWGTGRGWGQSRPAFWKVPPCPAVHPLQTGHSMFGSSLPRGEPWGEDRPASCPRAPLTNSGRNGRSS